MIFCQRFSYYPNINRTKNKDFRWSQIFQIVFHIWNFATSPVWRLRQVSRLFVRIRRVLFPLVSLFVNRKYSMPVSFLFLDTIFSFELAWCKKFSDAGFRFALSEFRFFRAASCFLLSYSTNNKYFLISHNFDGAIKGIYEGNFNIHFLLIYFIKSVTWFNECRTKQAV